MHRNVWVFDFKSLYPSIIRTFNIDPLSYVAEPSPGEDADRNAGRRVPARARDPAAHARRAVPAARSGEEARATKWPSHAIKILMNSFYGVLGTPACRFYNPALANSITGMGKEMLLWSKQWFEARRLHGALRRHRQLVRAFRHATMPERRARRARSSPRQLNEQTRALHRGALARAEPARAEVREAVSEAVPAARAAQHARREQTLRRPASRRDARCASSSSAWKSCAATGRRSPSKCSASSITACSPTSRSTSISPTSCDSVRDGELDDALVYRKNLRKDAEEYTATTPPHVVAARKSTQPLGRLDQLCHHHRGPGAARQRAASARSRALRREADQAGRGAGAGDARTGFRAGDRRQPPDGPVLAVRRSLIRSVARAWRWQPWLCAGQCRSSPAPH